MSKARFRALSSIRVRIAVSFAIILILLQLVAGVAVVSGWRVSESFARYDRAQKANQCIALMSERLTLLQWRVAVFADTETAKDETAAAKALAGLSQLILEPSSEAIDLLVNAKQEATMLSRLLADLASTIQARHKAGDGVVYSMTSLSLALSALQGDASAANGEDLQSAFLRTQSAAQRGSLFAVRYQLSASPSDLEAAKAEMGRLFAGLSELGQLLGPVTGQGLRFKAAAAAAQALDGATAALEAETSQREDLIGKMDRSVGRVRATLDIAHSNYADASEAAQQQLSRNVHAVARIVILVASVALALSVLRVLVLVRTCVWPLVTLSKSMRALAAGAMQQAVPHTARTDEIGEIAKALALLREQALRAREAEAEVERSVQRLAMERKRLATEKADVTAAALGGVAAAVGHTAERLLRDAANLSGIAGRTSDRAESVVTRSEQSRVSAEVVANSAGLLLASMEEMSRRVTFVASLTANAAQDASRTKETVSSLSTAASGVRTATELIVKVATRTKLLAFNASIEAARAGAAGSCFQVVAHEVRELATQTAAAAAEIARQMTTMEAANNEAIGTITAIRDAILSVDDVTTHAANEFQQQDMTMRGIVQATGESAAAASIVAAAMQAVLEDASEAALSVVNLRAVAEEVSTQGAVLETELHKVIEQLRAA